RHTRCLSDWSSDVCSSDLCLGNVGSPCMTAKSTANETILTIPMIVNSPVRCKRRQVNEAAFLLAVPWLRKGSRLLKFRFVHFHRSEERRVGKEGRSRWRLY